MNRLIRTALFAGTAIAAVATGMPQEASAQSITPGFFGSLSGWYYFSAGHDKTTYTKGFKGATHPDGGPGGKAYLGYRFGGPFDVAFGVQGSRLDKHKGFFKDGVATTKADYWAADAELGYNTNVNGLGVRLFAGVRYAQFNHQNKFGDTDGSSTFFYKSYKNNYWGIGPRIGTDFATRLGNSNFSIFGDVAGSVLFGKLKGVNSLPECGSECYGKDSGSRTVWNLEGQLGLAYEVAPGINIGAGYRGEYWSGVADAGFSPTFPGLDREGRSDRFMHGPFVRVSYNFGAPPAGPMMATMTPPPVQPAMAKKNFIVFFDFDRSTITTDAQKIINDAAATAKAGNATQVSVTGHTDRSGSEQYNMALSLRRAEAVKASLIKLGVPASLIVVVGKGESQPLVNTPDGVREPQNRRVEILI